MKKRGIEIKNEKRSHDVRPFLYLSICYLAGNLCNTLLAPEI